MKLSYKSFPTSRLFPPLIPLMEKPFMCLGHLYRASSAAPFHWQNKVSQVVPSDKEQKHRVYHISSFERAAISHDGLYLTKEFFSLVQHSSWAEDHKKWPTRTV